MGNAMSNLTKEERDQVRATGQVVDPTPEPKTSFMSQELADQAAINPKTAAGAKKPSLISVIPTASFLILGKVMSLGAKKYGAFNWRESKVPAETYLDAAMRHLISYHDGEDIDPESGVSHLGHVMACCAILIDAEVNGKLEDDRPIKGRTGEMISKFQKTGEF